MTSPAPGWYPDPHVPQQMRWWDGSAWTQDTYERTLPLDAGLGTPGVTGPATRVPGAARSTAQGTHATTTVGAPALRVTDDGTPLSGWGRRAVARILDGILVTMIGLVVAFPATADVLDVLRAEVAESMRAAQAGTQASSTLLVNPRLVAAVGVITLVRLLVSLAYEMGFLLWRQATPGKLLLGLRVRPWAVAGPLAPTTIARRWLASEAAWSVPQIGTAYNLIDVLWPLRDERRQALHDKFASTCVVQPLR